MALRHPIIDPELKRICGLVENKVCADCEQLGPQFVDLTHGVFICHNCTAVHKSMGFKTKGVHNSLFSSEEVQFLSMNGNRVFNADYMALLTAEEITSLPSQHRDDRSHLATFIRSKYIEKKWFSAKDEPSGSAQHRKGDVDESTAHAHKPNSIYQNVLANRSFYRSPYPVNSARSPSPALSEGSRHVDKRVAADASDAATPLAGIGMRAAEKDPSRSPTPPIARENQQRPPIARRIQSSPALVPHTHTPSPAHSPQNENRSRPHSYTGHKMFAGVGGPSTATATTSASRAPSPSLSPVQSMLLSEDTHYDEAASSSSSYSQASHLSYALPYGGAGPQSANNSLVSFAHNPYHSPVSHTVSFEPSPTSAVPLAVNEELSRLRRELEIERKEKRDLAIKLQDANRQRNEQEHLLQAIHAQAQSVQQGTQRALDLYRARPERLRDLSVRECEILENELVASLKRIAEYKMSLGRPPVADDQMCIVCGTHPRLVALMPCRHLCLCPPCAEAMPVNVCPVCKNKITQKILTQSSPPPPFVQ